MQTSSQAQVKQFHGRSPNPVRGGLRTLYKTGERQPAALQPNPRLERGAWPSGQDV
eukprot:CAMPEP_0204276352 /NCGR_PEP_ID=MMETSP0468-20130131/27930_1 /ASSEMBLY_ACC=CAM_ASM_000383 /TAXON_ID=2969 /ORGANISM="Oxyrrhis marina" /LENGTH=55 /DNA_ID=CAMNT_0051252939 /DNA_START=20 /DNA_END=183 /DNA_ORIENTATION=-